MILVGLSSLSLIMRTRREVVEIAKAAGVDAVEWAGDIHVPNGDPSDAEAAMLETLRAGLTVASYAPLYRALPGAEAGLRLESVLDTAGRLQAPFVRIYLGASPAARLAGADRARLVAEARRIGDDAGLRGRTICLSFGRNTSLTSYRDAVALVEEIGHPFVRLAWDALPGVPEAEASGALEAAGPGVAMLVARQLRPDGTAGSLASEEGAWRRRLAAFKRSEPRPDMGRFVLIGAVRDDPSACRGGDGLPCLAEDAALLRRLVGELEPPRARP